MQGWGAGLRFVSRGAFRRRKWRGGVGGEVLFSRGAFRRFIEGVSIASRSTFREIWGGGD